jgi:hypothetical protein
MYGMRSRKVRRVLRKDDYLGIRLPGEDKARLEATARRVKRDPSNLGWYLIVRGLDEIEREFTKTQPAAM